MVCEDKRRIIAYLWYLNALLSIAYVIVAICAAANQKDVSWKNGIVRVHRSMDRLFSDRIERWVGRALCVCTHHSPSITTTTPLTLTPHPPTIHTSQLETATTNHAAGFAAIWSMLVLFAIIVGGTITMKRVRACARVSVGMWNWGGGRVDVE